MSVERLRHISSTQRPPQVTRVIVVTDLPSGIRHNNLARPSLPVAGRGGDSGACRRRDGPVVRGPQGQLNGSARLCGRGLNRRTPHGRPAGHESVETQPS
jgi:hypothetical protein